METKCISIDFCDGRSNYEQIKKELRDIPVGILGKFLLLVLLAIEFNNLVDFIEFSELYRSNV